MIKRIEDCIGNLRTLYEVGEIGHTRFVPWDGFLKSIMGQVERNKTLSEKQKNHLSRIESACSSEVLSASKEWRKKYDSDLREIAVICAEYYTNHPDITQRYWTLIAEKVLKDKDGHNLSKYEFTRMCMNPYADKVIQEHRSTPRFKPGQVVQVRTTNRLDMAPEYSSNRTTNMRYKLHRKAARGERVLALVVTSNARPIYRAAKGGKVYSILPVGSDIKEPIYACEKDLKAVKIPKNS